MAIANDASVNGGGQTQATSANLNHVANALVVIFIAASTNPAITVSSVTVGGASAALLRRKNTLWSGLFDEEVWYIFRASAANEQVIVNLSGTPGGGGGVRWTAASFTGTATSEPFFECTADNSAESASVTVTVATGTAGRRIVQVIGWGNSNDCAALTLTGGQTQIQCSTAAYLETEECNYKDADGSTAMTATFSGAKGWETIGSAILPAPSIVYVNPTDAGSGTESSVSMSAAISPTDAGSGVEGGITVGPYITDLGGGIETTPTIAVSFTIAESGAGVEVGTISLTVTDASGAAVDVWALEGQIPISDTGCGVEATPSVDVSFTIADAGSDSEAIEVTAYAYPTDSGAGVETKYGGLTTYLLIYDVNTFAVETITTPGSIIILEEGLFAEFVWRQKPAAPMIDDLALPHVQSIIIPDVATMSDKKVQGSLPRRTMVGKQGRTVTIQGWTDQQSEINALEALMDGVTRTFYHPSGDSFAVLVTAFNPNLRVDEYDHRIYSLTLAEK